jgi:hypothetical protein
MIATPKFGLAGPHVCQGWRLIADHTLTNSEQRTHSGLEKANKCDAP